MFGFILLLGCPLPNFGGYTPDDSAGDADGDGFTATSGDCDDADASVNPAAAEDCATAWDDDCDGETNELDAANCSPCYQDRDGDLYGADSVGCLCETDGSCSMTPGDCDDLNAGVHPGASEICEDGWDNDCDGGSGPCEPTWQSLTTMVVYTGQSFEREAGACVAGAGDVNGDGFDELVVGAPGRDGGAYLVLGSATPASGDLASEIRFTGAVGGEEAGVSVAGAGDVNADGFDDVIVGASDGSGGVNDSGAAYLVLGGPTPSSLDLGTTLVFEGGLAECAGVAVAGAGDVNADGFDDLIIGSSCKAVGSERPGAAYLVLGSSAPASMGLSSAVEYRGIADDGVGRSVAGGDVNGDGYADVIAGAPGNNLAGEIGGAAYLILGSPVPVSDTVANAVVYVGASDCDLTGSATAGAGDVDGDGYDDFLVGAYYAGTDYVGAAYLVMGGSSPVGASLSTAVTYAGEDSWQYAGYSVSGAGDVDGDGHDDMLVGAPFNNDGGVGYLILGSTSPTSDNLGNMFRYTGDDATHYAARALAGAGDPNGDGYPDLVVGAPASSGAGVAYLVLGTGP